MKTEVEKLVDEIYHRQTYGLNADKHIEKLNRLTNTVKYKMRTKINTRSPKDKIDTKIFLIQMELKKNKPNLLRIDKLCFQMNNLLENIIYLS